MIGDKSDKCSKRLTGNLDSGAWERKHWRVAQELDRIVSGGGGCNQIGLRIELNRRETWNERESTGNGIG